MSCLLVTVDVEPAIICINSGRKVVLLSLDEYNSWQENHIFAFKFDCLDEHPSFIIGNLDDLLHIDWFYKFGGNWRLPLWKTSNY